MTIKHIGPERRFHFSAQDTARCPTSSLAGHAVDVSFEHGDLVDVRVDGGRTFDVDGYDLLCLVDDLVPSKYHPATMDDDALLAEAHAEAGRRWARPNDGHHRDR